MTIVETAKSSKKEKYPSQYIDSQKAAWIFISASVHEPRHLLDIVWAVDCLRTKKVPDDNIFIFQDNPQYAIHLSPFNITNNIFELSSLEVHFPKIENFEFVFLVFTGHGSSEGIPTSDVVFSPTVFMKLVRAIKGIRNGIFVIGQCYGGIFDYSEALLPPELGMLGATKLHLSLSSSLPTQNINLKDNTSKVLQPWNANVFLFYFFKWISSPLDIDGDGVTSLIDGFKFAASRSNETLTSFKTILSLDLFGRLDIAKVKIRKHMDGTSPLNPIELETALKTAEDESKTLYLHQEPWLLHATLLRSLILS